MLLWIDGFDAYGTTVGSTVAGFIEFYPESSENSGNNSVRAGRLGQNSVEVRSSVGNAWITTRNFGNITTFIVGVAFRPAFALTNNPIIELREDDNSTAGMNVFLNNTGTLSVRRGTTVLATSGTSIITVDTWHYIEFKVIVHNTAGSYELKVNNTSQLSASGVNTRSGATNNYANRVRLYGVGSVIASRGHWFDDLYVLDGSGSANNDFLGDRKVITTFPTVEGDNSDFTPSTGTDNAAMVDDNPQDGDSTYVESSTPGHRDLYALASVSVGTVNGVQQNVICRKTDVTNYDIKQVAKSGATTDVGPAQTVGSTTYGLKYHLHENDPNTAVPWDQDGINNAQFGYEVA